ELGGKSAHLIFADCDFARAVASAAAASLGTAGQDCCARSRIIVDEKIYDRFVAALIERFDRVRVGDPLSNATEMGPLVSTAHLDRVMQYVARVRSEGAKLYTYERAHISLGGVRGCSTAPPVFNPVLQV